LPQPLLQNFAGEQGIEHMGGGLAPESQRVDTASVERGWTPSVGQSPFPRFAAPRVNFATHVPQSSTYIAAEKDGMGQMEDSSALASQGATMPRRGRESGAFQAAQPQFASAPPTLVMYPAQSLLQLAPGAGGTGRVGSGSDSRSYQGVPTAADYGRTSSVAQAEEKMEQIRDKLAEEGASDAADGLREAILALSEVAEARASEASARTEDAGLHGGWHEADLGQRTEDGETASSSWLVASGVSFLLFLALLGLKSSMSEKTSDMEACCGMSLRAVVNMAIVLLLAAAGFCALWWQQIIQPILEQITVYMYLAAIGIAILGVLAVEAWKRVSELLQLIHDKVKRACEIVQTLPGAAQAEEAVEKMEALSPTAVSGIKEAKSRVRAMGCC